jgi:molybdopterin synthase sulfur carrier subunit
MAITVKFIGALRHVSGTSELTLGCKAGLSVGGLMTKIIKQNPEFKRSLIDEQLENPMPNALILVNGREISVLNGLETKLKDGDEIVLVPVVHGG